MPQPRALIFDLDGVLIDTEPLHRETWIEAFGSVGLELGPGDDAHLQGRRGEQVIEWMRGRFGEAAVAGIDAEKLLGEKRDRFWQRIEAGGPRPLPGAEAFLRAQKGKLPLGLVTSARLKLIGQIMHMLHWRNIFDALIGAEHVQNAKPHPEPYLRAAERFRLAPAECLVFEDSPVGLESARKAGCMICGVATTLSPRELAAAGADWTISDFSDEAALAEILAGRRPGAAARFMRKIFG